MGGCSFGSQVLNDGREGSSVIGLSEVQKNMKTSFLDNRTMVEKEGRKEGRMTVPKATLTSRKLKERGVRANLPEFKECFFEEPPEHACECNWALFRDEGRGGFLGDGEGDRSIPTPGGKSTQDAQVEETFETLKERGPWGTFRVVSACSPRQERLCKKGEDPDVKAVQSTILRGWIPCDDIIDLCQGGEAGATFPSDQVRA